MLGYSTGIANQGLIYHRRNRHCDYTPARELPRAFVSRVESLTVHQGACSHIDLSQRGATTLTQTEAATIITSACLTPDLRPEAKENSSILVHNLVKTPSWDFNTALSEFKSCVHEWCPIVTEEMLTISAAGISRQDPILQKWPPLALGVLLVARRPCTDERHLIECELYRALKQLIAIHQSRDGVELEKLQLGLLVATYELGHNKFWSAFQNLASCAAMSELFNVQPDASDDQLQTVHWLQASMLMLDRMNSLASPEPMPLSIPSDHPVCKSVASRLGPNIPDHPQVPHAASARKIHIRSMVAIASGHALEYRHMRRRRLEPDVSYEQANDTIEECIKTLVEKPEPHTWLHCDSIAMAFCSHILLQQAEMDHHSANMIHFSVPTPGYAKTHMALKASRRLSWDMVVVAIQKVKSEEEVALLPLAGIFCVLRAGVAVMETQKYVNEDVVKDEEIDGFVQLVKWFRNRWNLGRYVIGTTEISVIQDRWLSEKNN